MSKLAATLDAVRDAIAIAKNLSPTMREAMFRVDVNVLTKARVSTQTAVALMNRGLVTKLEAIAMPSEGGRYVIADENHVEDPHGMRWSGHLLTEKGELVLQVLLRGADVVLAAAQAQAPESESASGARPAEVLETLQGLSDTQRMVMARLHTERPADVFVGLATNTVGALERRGLAEVRAHGRLNAVVTPLGTAVARAAWLVENQGMSVYDAVAEQASAPVELDVPADPFQGIDLEADQIQTEVAQLLGAGDVVTSQDVDRLRTQLDRVQYCLENKLRANFTETEIAKLSMRRTRLEQAIITLPLATVEPSPIALALGAKDDRARPGFPGEREEITKVTFTGLHEAAAEVEVIRKFQASFNDGDRVIGIGDEVLDRLGTVVVARSTQRRVVGDQGGSWALLPALWKRCTAPIVHGEDDMRAVIAEIKADPAQPRQIDQVDDMRSVVQEIRGRQADEKSTAEVLFLPDEQRDAELTRRVITLQERLKDYDGPRPTVTELGGPITRDLVAKYPAYFLGPNAPGGDLAKASVCDHFYTLADPCPGCDAEAEQAAEEARLVIGKLAEEIFGDTPVAPRFRTATQDPAVARRRARNKAARNSRRRNRR